MITTKELREEYNHLRLYENIFKYQLKSYFKEHFDGFKSCYVQDCDEKHNYIVTVVFTDLNINIDDFKTCEELFGLLCLECTHINNETCVELIEEDYFNK